MPNNVIKAFSFEELVNPVPAKEAFQREMVSMPCMTIDENLTDKTVHILRRYVIKWMSSPQMLCTMTNGELQSVLSALNDELSYREDERNAG